MKESVKCREKTYGGKYLWSPWNERLKQCWETTVLIVKMTNMETLFEGESDQCSLYFCFAGEIRRHIRWTWPGSIQYGQRLVNGKQGIVVWHPVVIADALFFFRFLRFFSSSFIPLSHRNLRSLFLPGNKRDLLETLTQVRTEWSQFTVDYFLR